MRINIYEERKIQIKISCAEKVPDTMVTCGTHSGLILLLSKNRKSLGSHDKAY
jgi:hypothetical protein